MQCKFLSDSVSRRYFQESTCVTSSCAKTSFIFVGLFLLIAWKKMVLRAQPLQTFCEGKSDHGSSLWFITENTIYNAVRSMA